MPQIDDYYEPWTYDYEKLITAPLSKHDPVAPAALPAHRQAARHSSQWGPNWDDNLAGAPERIHEDPLTDGIQEQVKASYEEAFMFYLPRICEHCLNPSCVASCPSGAMYKREEDGIVLVDQEKCRGWRFCVSGCPYKKVYFNHKTNKAEKCTLCYPRIEAGQPTICSETCVGRIRYIGLVLYDSDRVEAAASVPDEHDLLDAQREVFVDPEDPAVREQAARDGIPDDWIQAARRSPVYALAHRYRVALPLHPEYRTLPMVWYVPPLSPIVNSLETDGYEADPDHIFPAIDSMRIPVDYLANLLAAGDAEVIRDVLRRLAAMRGHMRKREVLGEHDADAAGDGRDERRRRRGHVPAAGDRQVRRSLRDPEGARRARRPADGAAGQLRARLRGRPRQLRRGSGPDPGPDSRRPARGPTPEASCSPRATRAGSTSSRSPPTVAGSTGRTGRSDHAASSPADHRAGGLQRSARCCSSIRTPSSAPSAPSSLRRSPSCRTRRRGRRSSAFWTGGRRPTRWSPSSTTWRRSTCTSARGCT